MTRCHPGDALPHLNQKGSTVTVADFPAEATAAERKRRQRNKRARERRAEKLAHSMTARVFRMLGSVYLWDAQNDNRCRCWRCHRFTETAEVYVRYRGWRPACQACGAPR